MLKRKEKTGLIHHTDIDNTAFTHLIGKVTHCALELLEPEYVAFKQAYQCQQPISQLCRCETKFRYLLPCQHILAGLLSTPELPIPLTSLHPRWLIDGPAIVLATWVFPDSPLTGADLHTTPMPFVDNLQDNGCELFVTNLRQQQQFQQTLNGEDAERYAVLHQRVTQ